MNAVNQNVLEMQKRLEQPAPQNSTFLVSLEMKQKILLRMMKEHLAVQLRPDEYLVFCLETADHRQKRNGVLARLHRPSLLEPQNDAKWVTFHSLFTTNQTYLMQVTPVTFDMVADVCGRQYADLIEEWENNNKIVPILKFPISPKIQTKLLGTHGKKKAALINQLQCHDIENSIQELTLTVWATVADRSFVEA